MALEPHDLLDTDELAALLGVRPSSLRAMRSQPARHRSVDGLPAPLRLVSGRPVWERATVEAWMAQRTTERSTPSEPAPVTDEPATEEPWVPWPQEAQRP